MKKVLILLTAFLFLGYNTSLKAQCYGVVHFDVAATAGVVGNAGNSTFTITTANANELIMIAYDGWNGPGTGPVTVDGNPATFVANSITGNSGSAMTYAYVAPAAGVHTIVASTGGYNSGYYINMAAAFYVTGTCTPLSIASLISTTNSISCTTGGSITGSITTTIPGSMIYTNCEINEGQPTTYPISWTGATFLGNEHTEDGIDAGQGYTTATAVGPYSFTATNSSPSANGCGGLTLVLTAIQPPLCSGITLTTTQVNPTCGNNNGSATVGVTGGTAPYTYAWTPSGGTSATATGLSAGTYTVTVKDKNGCSATASVVLVSTASVAVTTTVVNVKCNGGATGSATATAAGGTAPYTYAWTPSGGTSATASGLTAGTYTITVKDKNGCVGTATAIITEPPALTATTTVIPAKCNGGFGSSTVTAGGGTPAYLYSWAPGGNTNANATNLTAGTYTVTVTDANGCTITATSIITQPPVLTATTTVVNVKCNAGATGSATVTAGGGTPAYIYTWAPGGQTNATATNLTAGTYTITVKDANGCTVTATAIITQPPVLTATTTVIPVKCNGGATGSTTVTAGGGTPAYLYSWAPGGQTNANATNLTAGTYTVTVTDANGCTITATSVITQPPVLTATTSVVNVKCNGGVTGSATVTAGGGTPAYLYSWAPGGQTNANATNLTAGTYTVTVTDANGCTITATAIITQPTPLTATTTTTTATCGNPDGSATVTAGGGVPAYVYTWAPSGGTNATASNLTAGTYTVTVKDANGCTVTALANVGNAAAETVTITGTTNILCNGGANGSITTNTVGGTLPYTYSWAPGGQTGANATGLTAGTYVVTVKDANGCISIATATLTQPTAVTATTTNTPVLCNGGATGSATVTAGGGTPAYVYTWAPGGQTNTTATNLTAGTYTVTVKDANGCTITATAIITQPTALTETTGAIVNVLCNGGNNGSATATAAGGTPGYVYSWSNGQTGANASGLTAGIYTVTATDANGCTITATATITEPTALTASTTTITATCGKPNGSATVTAGGGTPGYLYSWVPGGQTSATATNLTSGIYTVTVTDANGCTITATANIGNAAAETVTITGTVPVSCFGGANGSITTNTVGGTLPYAYAWTPVGGTSANATGLSAATYTVTVTDANGCIATVSTTITQPTALTETTGGIVNVLCNGGNNGSATANAGGGTPAYAYAWSNGQTGTNATGLTAGVYTVTATDANGCTITATATITEPPALTVTTGGVVNVLCNGGSNGSATATAGGGTPAYAYAWSNGQTGTNATGLTVGVYTVTVTDANGCTVTATATITQPTPLTATTSFTASTCGNANGSATATPAGGTGPYAYSWTTIPVQTTATATNVSAGTYTVTVTDANGCTVTAAATVSNLTGETVSINPPVNVLCNGGNNGSATPVVVGGTAPYTYKWTPSGQTNATATGLSAGTYTLNVSDANGCTASASVTVTQPPLLTVTTAPSKGVLCNGGATGSDLATAAGGTGAYLYTWAPGGQTTASASGLSAGTYTIQVTDANGCTATATTTVTQPAVVTLTAAGFPTTCNGGSDGQATAIPGGGTPPYMYAWSNGTTTANANNLSAGNYTVIVTDANGCTHDSTVTVSQPAPIVVAFTADTANGCSPLCTGFINTSTDPGGIIIKWLWVYSDGGTDTVKNPRHCFTSPGSYTATLTVTDNHGCTSTLAIPNIITVYSSPVPNFTMSPQPTTILDPTIQFTDKSTDAYGIASWLWSFNDPQNDVSDNTQNPSHKYSDTGTYCASLVVTNIHGCVDSITQCLVISPEYTLYIPDAFSPNGDGINDIFQPKGAYVTEYQMYIFDRWGMLIYSTNDMNKGWNGGVNNSSKVCQIDTYVYKIEVVDYHGKKHSYIGKVTLLQ